MIQPNAKCVVNGKKVNEIAGWLNQFINLTEEEIDIVDTGNTPGKRWFLTGKLAGDLGAGSAEDGDRNNLGGTSGNSQGSVGGGNNRDQLNTGGRPLAPGSSVGAAVDIRSGVNSAGIDTGKSGVAADSRRGVNSAGIDTGVDQFGNTIGGTGGDLRDDGMTAEQARKQFLEGKKRAAASSAPLPGAPPPNQPTTPPPTPGAPPLGGDTTPPPLPGAPPLGDTDKAAADTAAADAAAARQRRNDKINAAVQAEAESIRRRNEEKAAEEARKRAEDEKKRAEDAKRRIAARDKLIAKQEVRTQANIEAATSPERSDKIAAIKDELYKVVKQIVEIERQIPTRPFARQMWIAANANGLWKKRNDLEEKRKQLTKQMTSL